MSKLVVITVIVGAAAVLLANHFFRTLPSPIVTIDDGQLQGRMEYSRDGMQYFAYLSIPFAEAPVGQLRFEAPIPLKKPWVGVKQVTKYPQPCLHFDCVARGKMDGAEDCLYLNVFTHGLKGKRPVMVYIHGGGFQLGASNQYHPEYFMDEDIVLVTMNYRLGILGFMNLEDGLIRGNMGLKDQNMALKWVQQNIARFGGDPENVVLFGESAGAASAAYHMISPASKGLFQRAILQSGAVTCPWAFRHEPKNAAHHFIANTKCSNKEGEDMVKCLKQIDAVDLVKQLIELMDPTVAANMFLPSIETVVKEDTFLTENPRKLLKSGNIANNVPVMLGVTSGEGTIRTARVDAMPEVIPTIDKNWESMAARLLYYADADVPAETAKKLRNKYFESGPFTEDLHEFKRNFTMLASDIIFFAPIQKAAMLHAKHGAPTYMYYYNYEYSSLPSVYSLLRAVRIDDWMHAEVKMFYAFFVDLIKKNWLNERGVQDFGITHGDDAVMLWNIEGFTSMLMPQLDLPFSKAFVKTFVDFAKNKEFLEFNGVSWPSINPDDVSPQYMLIGKEPKVIAEPFTEAVRFWESLEIRE